MDIGPSEAETFWTAFLRKLARRGLRGVKLVISDAHEGIKAAVSKVLNATWQIAELRRAGKLNDSAVNRFAVRKQIAKLTVALAQAWEASVRSIERLLSNSSDVDQLVIACKAARLRWATTVSILNNREGCLPIEGDELNSLGGLFESLSLSEAQRTVRFGPATKQ